MPTIIVPRREAPTYMTPCRQCSPSAAVPHYTSNKACRFCTYSRAEAARKSRKAQVKDLRAENAELRVKLKEMVELANEMGRQATAFRNQLAGKPTPTIVPTSTIVPAGTKPTEQPNLLGDINEQT